jgi:endophilin-B
MRMGEVISEKLDLKGLDNLNLKKDQRPNNLEHLGAAMQEAGQTFGPDIAYGSALLKVAQTQMKLGASEREMVQTTTNQTLAPIRRFLEGDMKNIQVLLSIKATHNL